MEKSPELKETRNVVEKEKNLERFILFRGIPIRIVRGPDGLWRTADGTILALRNDNSSIDHIDRCGIGFLSLSTKHPLTAACTPHDYAYSSPAYQLFHTKKEADLYLKFLIEQIPGWWWLANPFAWLAHLFGGRFWENQDTRTILRDLGKTI